jgi:hypothetical protein
LGGLRDVRELMRQKTQTVSSIGPVRSPGKVDVAPDGKRVRRKVSGGPLSRRTRVDAHGAEGAIECGLERRADDRVDRVSGVGTLGDSYARRKVGLPT